MTIIESAGNKVAHMTQIKSISSRKGFTLVEALVASAVLALGLFTIGVTTYTQFAFINQNREKAIATLAAQEEIENIRGMTFDAVASLGSSFNASGFTYLKNPAGVLRITSSYGSDIKKISVNVSWDSLVGKRSQVNLLTLVTRQGITNQQ